MITKWIYFLTLPFILFAQSSEQIFTRIYEYWPWTNEGFSYSGSQIEITQEYVDFLETFLKTHEIQSIVDLGCGDWAFSRYIDFSGIEYKGIDVVKMVIERNQKLFNAPNISFIYGNAFEMELPEADLLIVKDVFQHLSNADIFKILGIASKYKHCLFTDFISPAPSIADNVDISTGGLHFVDLTKPPFNVEGKKALTFFTTSIKQTLHIQNR